MADVRAVHGLRLINAQDMPTRSAMIADTVPPAIVTSAVTLFHMALAITLLLGAPVTGWVVDHLGFAVSYLIASSGHVAVLVVIARMRAGRKAADPDARMESVRSNMREGLRYLRQDAAVRWIVILTWAVFTAGISVMGLLIAAWVDDILALGATGWGLMMVTWGAGGVLVSATLTARGEYGHKGPLFLAAALGFGLTVIGFGLSRSLAAAFFFNGVAGGMHQLLLIVSIASLQNVVPNRLLGRVLALLLLAQGTAQVAGLGVGAIGQLVGLELLYPAAGLVVVLITVAAAASQRPLRALD